MLVDGPDLAGRQGEDVGGRIVLGHCGNNYCIPHLGFARQGLLAINSYVAYESLEQARLIN